MRIDASKFLLGTKINIVENVNTSIDQLVAPSPLANSDTISAIFKRVVLE